MSKKKFKVRMPDGEILEKNLSFSLCGNFYIGSFTHKGKKYLAGDGDEYLHGYPEVMDARLLPNQN